MYCRSCDSKWEDHVTHCPICLEELESGNQGSKWVRLGVIEDTVSAGFAREVLKSYEIPGAVISKSGFFGNAGLTFPNFYKTGSSLFEVWVPEERADEAAEVVKMAIGEAWHREDT